MTLQPKPESQWTSKDHEEVLCVHRGWLENTMGAFHGFSCTTGFLGLLQRHAQSQDAWGWYPRGYCETNPDLKQLIPYMLVFDTQQRIFTYWRSQEAGEQRLHGKRSVGLGGHLNRVDNPLPHLALVAGARRELLEELTIEGGHVAEAIGLVNDESTEVGSVHLGVVIAVGLCHNATARDPELAKPELVDRRELFGHYEPEVHDEFEDWSRLVLTGAGVIRDNMIRKGSILWRSK